MTEKPRTPEEKQPIIDRLPMDKAMHLSSQERQQIYQELSKKEGHLRAELEAMNAYLSDQWDPEKIAEQYPEAARKGYDFPQEAIFHVPGKNVRIEGDGIVSYRILKQDRYQKDRLGDWYKLTWDCNLYRPKVQDYAKDPEKLKQLIEDMERNGINIPNTIKAHFEKIQKEKEELDKAFENGKRFSGVFSSTHLKEHFSSPTAPEEIEVDIRLKEGANPTETNELDPETQQISGILADYYYGELPGVADNDRLEDPKLEYPNWRVSFGEGFSYKDCSVLHIEKIMNDQYKLTIGGSFSGDEFSSDEIGGEIVIDMTSGKIIEGTLVYEAGDSDGRFEAEYTL